MTKIPNFENSRWRTAAILKIVLSLYLSRKSSDFNEIWYADADYDSKVGCLTKYQNFSNSKWKMKKKWRKKSTTHTFNVINISEYHHSQGGGSVNADFSLLGQKWAESGILLYPVYLSVLYVYTKFEADISIRSKVIRREPKFRNLVTWRRPRPLGGRFVVRTQ